MNDFDSNENFDQKSLQSKRTSQLDSRSPSKFHRIEYPGRKDTSAAENVEKCLAFYQNVRQYFDDDVAAILLKCCLCHGDCSGKK